MNIFAPVVDSRDTVPSAAAADNEINGEIETRDRCKGSNATGAGRRNGRACSSLSPHAGGKFNIGNPSDAASAAETCDVCHGLLTRCTGGSKDQIA
jgi:hypothetical protein